MLSVCIGKFSEGQAKGKGKSTEGMRKKLTKAARCAIKMRSKDENKSMAIKKIFTMAPFTALEYTKHVALIIAKLQKVNLPLS